jgi:predicted secreted protein
MRYDEHANGRQIDVKLNEEFEISLPEVRTAGYRWVTKRAGAPVCQLLGETTQPNLLGVGGSGQRVWQLRAIAAGTGEIEFLYRRPWEGSEEPARTFALKVRVGS